MKLSTQNPPMDLFRKKCKENSLKITPQRIAIYQELLKSKDHPNAEALHKRVKKIIPDISLDTVNRTLLTYSKIGIIHVVEGYGEARRYDPHIANHHHFRCVSCNVIIDLDYKPYDAIIIPTNIQKVHSVLSKKILLEGYCHKCRNRQ